ncbi:type VI secretion protein [Enterobacter roggenkampii]|uniref:type VI secretion system protein TssA n=1 Tax=Enterobacter TaxID=547 RepID=UPI0005F98CCE|nr:type VI secretion system protein TssA [Enterobacter mori]KJX01432.1 type VI secretion protein [Enterobacter roggenkampii]MCG5129785.1 type VI secretion system protein TssA [Enterobacter mori]
MLSEINELLLPIHPEAPAGDNLEYESLFDEIRVARESDPDGMPEDEWSVREPRKADWNQVRNLSEKALREQSKDLQLACWYAEALCQLQGLAGLSTGIAFLSEFITRFWFQCWPLLEEDGLTMRRSKLQRLDRDLSQQLLRQPMLRQANTSLLFWRQILAFEHKINTHPGDRDELIRKEGDFTMESFDQQAMNFSSIEIGQQAARVEALASDLSQLEARYLSLSQDPESDVFIQSRQTLKDLADYLQRLTQRAVPLVDESLTLEPIIEDAAPLTADTPVWAPKQTMSREVAISQMLAIAGYFRQTEPSSPVPFLMERAARWATMTLPEWLEEMLNDSNSIIEINNVLTGNAR